jgi:hypothetical protein
MNVDEYLKDAYAGDVVRIHHVAWPKDAYCEGPIFKDESHYRIGGQILESWAGFIDRLEVISRAPRPLYNNHPRSRPRPGDVVIEDGTAWLHDTWGKWHSCHSDWTHDNFIRNNRGKLTLVIDGETGEVVK